MLAGLFSPPCSLDLQITQDSGRKFVPLGRDKKGERALIFSDGEDVSGTLTVGIKPGKRIQHLGIKVEFIGQVDMVYDRSNSYDFFSIAKDIEPPGVLMETKQCPWKFTAVDKPYETYSGTNVKLRYFVRLTVVRNYATSLTKEVDIVVQNPIPQPDLNTSIKMEVGIEDCLHIEFEYDKSKYHLKDALVGKVYFMLVRIKIKHMQLDIIRQEAAGSGSNVVTEVEPVSKFEIMDGAPVRLECIPVRLYLGGLDLTPTYKNIFGKFSVKYFVNLVLVDEEDRRYFKKQEMTLWRKKIG